MNTRLDYLWQTGMLSAVWSPQYGKTRLALERVERGFTRVLPGMESFSNEERLGSLGLFSLEHRRLMENI